MTNFKTARFPLMVAVLMGTLGLSACTTVGYRCRLDPNGKSEYPTACSGMQDALAGAKKGTGGKTSVLMDDQGRLVPRELLENKVAVPLTGQAEPYREKSGDPLSMSGTGLNGTPAARAASSTGTSGGTPGATDPAAGADEGVRADTTVETVIRNGSHWLSGTSVGTPEKAVGIETLPLGTVISTSRRNG